MTRKTASDRCPSRTRIGALTALAVSVTLLGSACGAPLPKLEPGQSPSAYSGLEVGEDRIEYAVGKVPGIVEDELEESGVPGAAVAVVHAGEVVLSEGFGVRSTETGESVDPQTVFPLASISKPVSATVVAAETAGGEVDWTTPVREYLPWFALSDPRATEDVTVGDLFAHRSGLPEHAGDNLEDLGYDRPAILHGLRHLPLEPLRTSHAYTNFGLTAAAEAVAVSARTPWAQLSRQRIFDPLGMSDTSYSHEELLERDNRAVGHVQDESGESGASVESGESSSDWVPANPARDPDAQAPAGGLSSSVSDMARWMAMVLADGKDPSGVQIVPTDALREALTPQSVASPPQAAADRAGSYGYGFDISTTSSGRVQWSHSGAFTQGSATAMLMIPSLDLGIITLTNSAPVGVPETINARFADYAQYGDPALPWRDLYAEALGPLTAPVGDLVEASRPSRPEPAPELGDLVGVYRNDYFGEIQVREVARTESDRSDGAARSEGSGGSDGATRSERSGGPGATGSGGDNDDAGAAQTTSDDDDDAPLTLELLVGPGRQIWSLEHWDGTVFAASPRGENWPPGSRGSVSFDGDTVTVELLNLDGLGAFTRVED